MMYLRSIALAALALTFSAAFPAAAQQETVSWFENYDEGLAEAKRTGKPIFLEYRCAP